MESTNKTSQEDDKKQTRTRYEHLRNIERDQQKVWAEKKLFETNATEGYEKLEFEQKNAQKYFTTFPYPYMNGYLHLGHGFSMSKNEF